MANRSHLYTCDDVPGGKGFHARGLSEYGWDIPLVHKLMVGTNPRIVRSAIWEHDIAILADRDGAFERTIAFFDKVGEGDLGDRKEFDDELAQMKEFLASTPPSKYILLEGGEILDLLGEDLNKLIADLAAEIPDLAARASRAVAGQEDEWLGELRGDWEEKARPGYWSDVLYYSFDGVQGDQEAVDVVEEEDDDDEAPAPKAAEAAEEPAAEEPAAEEPAAEEPAAEEPAAKKPAAKQPAAKAAKTPAKAAAKKPTKPATKKPTAKKPAKKPAAKKPAKKSAKPATNKPAAKKPAKKSAAKKPAKKSAKKPAAKKR